MIVRHADPLNTLIDGNPNAQTSATMLREGAVELAALHDAQRQHATSRLAVLHVRGERKAKVGRRSLGG